MPAKAPLDENVKFLYSCILRSDLKTIDFARVAADFSINPSAARMRWSRLKKSINPEELSLPAAEPSKKTKRSPKKKRDSKELKEVKELVREIQKEKRSERKAKIRAGKKIGSVIKDEDSIGDEEEDIAEASEYDNKDEEMAQEDEEELILEPDTIKFEDKETIQRQLTPEQTQEEDILLRSFQSADPAFGIFQLPPATPSISDSFPVTPTSSQVLAPEADDGMDKIWASTITFKHEYDPKIDATSIPIAFTSSPASSNASFTPTSSAHTSPSPPSRTAKQPEGTPQKWRAVGKFQGDQTRSRSRKQRSTDDDEDIEF